MCLIVTSFIVLSAYGWIPKWLTITVISRDIIIVTGWVLLFFIFGTSRVEPSTLGKVTIWLQSLLIAYILIQINLSYLPDISDLLLYATAGLTILSGLHYIYRGLKITHAH
jgi:cardiolipin synthase